MSQYPLRLPTDTYAVLKAEAEATGRSINALLVELVETHLDTDRAAVMAVITEAAKERYAGALEKLAGL
jgi:hypothetical protein